ncbi:MAG: nickel pincer cofactor biosynthesis protein LarB [Gemmataceae bacterium]
MSRLDPRLEILQAVGDGKLKPDEALRRLGETPAGFADLGYARIDLDRKRRCGQAEVIFGQGKTAEWIIGGASRLLEAGQNCLVTRVPEEAAQSVLAALPSGEYDPVGRTFWLKASGANAPPKGRVLVLTAGTSDLPVAYEARTTALALGTECRLVADVGVAGLHRLLSRAEDLDWADAIVVVAGMDGALPSVVGGLVSCPVFAVPTSVGYGAAFGGVAALLTMLNACSAGVAVVNIDAGFKGGYLAAMVALRSARQS